MKWGSRYGPEFVNRLYTSIKKHTKKTTKVYCFTDDIKGVNKNVICKPLPKIKLPKTEVFSGFTIRFSYIFYLLHQF